MKHSISKAFTIIGALLAILLISPTVAALELADLAGTWNMAYDMGQGAESGTITISEEPDGSAKIVMATSAGGNSEANDFSIEGETVSFSREVDAQGQSLEVSYTAQLVDGKLQGSFEVSLGGGATSWSAEKAN